MSQDPLSQLKQLLLDEDQRRIHELEAELARVRKQLADREQLLSTLEPVIADLLERKIADSKEEMAEALAPVIGQAIKKQVEESRDDVVDALYPVVGRMISKAMTEAMKRLVQNINQTLNQTLNVRLWFKKVKARVLGLQPGEVLLAESLVFLPREALLIHRNTGLLLAHQSLQSEGRDDNSAQILAGMLTAIQSFVQDAFAREDEEGDLREIEYGEYILKVDRGRYTFLVVVCQGVPPVGLDQEIQKLHLKIHNRFHRALRAFEGQFPEQDQVNGLLARFLKTLTKNHS